VHEFSVAAHSREQTIDDRVVGGAVDAGDGKTRLQCGARRDLPIATMRREEDVALPDRAFGQDFIQARDLDAPAGLRSGSGPQERSRLAPHRVERLAAASTSRGGDDERLFRARIRLLHAPPLAGAQPCLSTDRCPKDAMNGAARLYQSVEFSDNVARLLDLILC
jgi:hypothetical protein